MRRVAVAFAGSLALLTISPAADARETGTYQAGASEWGVCIGEWNVTRRSIAAIFEWALLGLFQDTDCYQGRFG
jgi:hypothetical protein